MDTVRIDGKTIMSDDCLFVTRTDNGVELVVRSRGESSTLDLSSKGVDLLVRALRDSALCRRGEK